MKDFEIFYNALSIGWHLKKVLEIEPKLLDDPILYNKFLFWLERHIAGNKYKSKYVSTKR
jgi:hypothetical protein